MSVLLDENGYKLVRKNDPAYQAMTRISDANNIYDIKQRYIKNANQNDFAEPLSTWSNNRGLLNDGKYINMNDFFMEIVPRSIGGVTRLEGHNIPYFRFKTNAILDYRNGARVAGTYIDKTKQESIYSTINVNTVDESGDIATVYGQNSEKSLVENTYNSYPLQRVDKLVVYDLASLFLYVNGRKIPDNEMFVYTNKSFTDVFIPTKYLGNIEDSSFYTDCTIAIDYRQAGSEELYFRDQHVNGNTITVDLKDEQYDYVRSIRKGVTKDKVVLFINGLFNKAADASINENGILTVTLEDNCSDADVEMYILNNIVYRSTPEDTHMVNTRNNKLHFYLNDDYVTDILCGPITKSAVSFFYDKKRIDDDLITQTSRFSFEYAIDVEEFNPNKVEFFIEDINWKVSDIDFKTYGDDYYLLNLLGVGRCVNKMRGFKSYSVFDDTMFSDLSFSKALSNNGDLFDVVKATKKYTDLDYNINSPTSRTKELVRERPTLLRRVLEQWKIPYKRLVVIGNEEDIHCSSVSPITDPSQQVYYKIYVNHILISTMDYSTERIQEHDIITISKNVLDPVVASPEHEGFDNGVNEIEIFQYDMTHKNKIIFKDNINGYSTVYEPDGSRSYTKTYNMRDLPFDGMEFVSDDLCAIEKVAKEWFDSNCKEYYMLYPNAEKYGYRLVKSFTVTEKTDDIITFKVQLHDYLPEHTDGMFFIMLKQYNVVEEYIVSNEDQSYMIDNDIAKPIFSAYTEYSYENGKRVVKELYDYIPYITNSEPVIQQNGKEMIYGDSYTFITPATNDACAGSFLVLKNQPKVSDVFTIMFNSNKTNILIVGYDNLNINNRYGLVYFSELKYPISPEYMNIIVNGEKLSALDMDILSDKLVRFHHVYRPITSILITTNSQYKDAEIQDYIDLYKESEFEKVLEEIFHNCDPSKKEDAEYPIVDYVYKVNPYYSDFVGEEEENYSNPYYKEYVDYIYEHQYEFDRNSIWSIIKPKPNKDEEPEKYEAWVNAEKFFSVYKWNHGFIDIVDSIKQRENPVKTSGKTYKSDILAIMYLNWLARSGKTKTYGFKDRNIDPFVLKYFSVYQNTIIDNRIDVVVDSSIMYAGLQDDINEPIRYDWNKRNPKPIYQYPGAQIDLRRRYFWNMFLTAIEEKRFNNPEDGLLFASTPQQDEDDIVEALSHQRFANILYPRDFPLEPDRNGIRWTGTDVDIVNYPNPS